MTFVIWINSLNKLFLASYVPSLNNVLLKINLSGFTSTGKYYQQTLNNQSRKFTMHFSV